ncbi:MAG TPA: glycosyltransferase, partial [Alphaproteobacteria bacterium]|nr:glycosyltransferase [Alphaproteobacteria bacterium]
MGADVGDFEEVATIPCDSPPGITTLAVPINQDQAILDLFLQSLAATEASGCHVIFVVDGGCTATVDALVGWTAALSSKATAAKIFVNRHPKGWGRCISFAMEMCKSEFLVTLDSDLVLIPGWLDQLIAVATARANVGAV